MKQNYEQITIAITNLYTGNWEYFNIYNLDDYNEAFEEWNKESINYNHDYEVQLIDHDYEGRLSDSNLEEFLKLTDENDVNPQDVIFLINAVGIDTAKEIIENGEFYTIVEADNKIAAFEEFAKSIDLIQIPEHLESYIDWESVMIDYECGSMTIEKVECGTYLIVY